MINMMSRMDLAKIIEHTLLDPSAGITAINNLCNEAVKFSFYAVVVNPYYVKHCSNLLRGTGIKVVSVIAFPFGATYSKIKEMEARKAIEEGADELDMMMNISAAKSGQWEVVRNDIEGVSSLTKKYGKVLKVIIEVGMLTDAEKVRACQVVEEAGADFVKSSSGFFGIKTTPQDIRIMAEAVGNRIGIKAAGGIRTAEEALAMVKAGATRIGSSHGVNIIETLKEAAN
jgi:deoxyribose-phosphate aldolase